MSDTRLEVDAELDALIRLLEWGRKQGVRIGPEVTVGSISVKVDDLRQTKKEGLMPQREYSILEEHGMPGDDE